MISELGFWLICAVFVALWLLVTSLRRKPRKFGSVSRVSYGEAFSPWDGGVPFVVEKNRYGRKTR